MGLQGTNSTINKIQFVIWQSDAVNAFDEAIGDLNGITEF